MKYRFLIIGLVVVLAIIQLIGTSNDHALETKPHSNNPQNMHTNYWQKLATKSQFFFNKFYSSGKIAAVTVDKKSNHKSSSSAAKANLSIQKPSSSNLVKTDNNMSQNSIYMEDPENKPTYVYISENVGNDILRCKLENNGVSDCKVILNNLKGPQDMVIIKDKFYLVNYHQPIMLSCDLLANGDIEYCSQTILPITTKPVYMIYSSYSLYITDIDLKKTVQCNLDYNLLAQNCIPVPPVVSSGLVNSPYQLFNTSKCLGYTYVTLYDSMYVYTVNKCVESACSVLYDPNLSGPNTIKILNHTAYLTDGNTNNLVSCPIVANGDFAPCKVLKGGLQTPVAIAFYSPKV